jgi:hypothetical protein
VVLTFLHDIEFSLHPPKSDYIKGIFGKISQIQGQNFD